MFNDIHLEAPDRPHPAQVTKAKLYIKTCLNEVTYSAQENQTCAAQ